MDTFRVFIAIGFGLAVAGCNTLRPTDTTPPLLVDPGQVELAVRAYVEATRALAVESGLTTGQLVANASATAPTNSFKSFLSTRGAPAASLAVELPGDSVPILVPPHLDPDLVIHFLRTGSAAAFILCQEYVAGLADKTDLLEYLRKEYNYAGTLTSTAFAIFRASSTAKSVLDAVNSFANNSLDNYEEYKFFRPTDEAVLDVALKAQAELRDYYTQMGGHQDDGRVPVNLGELYT
ncbi:MAG: hypothetical protein JO273_25815 [Methylobacteriaceae bacterium]|nr:hypothetical protein [Methylobacteriaceae bacterium]